MLLTSLRLPSSAPLVSKPAEPWGHGNMYIGHLMHKNPEHHAGIEFFCNEDQWATQEQLPMSEQIPEENWKFICFELFLNL